MSTMRNVSNIVVGSKVSEMGALERELAAKRTHRAELVSKLEAARVAIAQRRADLARHAGGDPGAFEKAAAALAPAEAKAPALAAAIEQVDREIAELTKQIEATADRELRNKTSRQLIALSRRIQLEAPRITEAFEMLERLSAPAARFVQSANGLPAFASHARKSIGELFPLISRELESRAQKCSAGTGPSGFPPEIDVSFLSE